MMLRFFTLRFNFLSSGIYTCSTFPAFLSRISTFFGIFLSCHVPALSLTYVFLTMYRYFLRHIFFLPCTSTFFDLRTGAVLYMGNSGVAVLSAYPRGVYGIFFK